MFGKFEYAHLFYAIYFSVYMMMMMMMMTDEAFAHGELKFARANVMRICGYANYIGNDL
jgi:hypothetical protein